MQITSLARQSRYLLFASLGALLVTSTLRGESGKLDFGNVPGRVIYHSPADSGIYVGSPGIVQLLGGEYLAKSDEFGPRSTEKTDSVTRVFRSQDKGETWTQLPAVHGIYWATIFEHRGAVYLMGPELHYGRFVILKST